MKKMRKRILGTAVAMSMTIGGVQPGAFIHDIAVPSIIASAESIEKDGFIYEVGENEELTVIGYEGEETKIVIPSEVEEKTVTAIGNDAFKYNNTIEEVVIPDSVKSIGNYAFNSCENLTSVDMPEDITIGDEAFSYKDINSDGFIFRNINYSGKLTLIGYEGSASEVIIPSEVDGMPVVAIGEWAFPENDSIVKIVVPDSVKTIGNGAFRNCHNISDVTLPEGIEASSDIFSVIIAESEGFSFQYDFENKGWTVVNYEGTDTEVVIPAEYNGKPVTGIGEKALWSGSEYSKGSITSVTLPDSVITIGDRAFMNQPLTSLTLPASLKSVGVEAFARGYSIYEGETEDTIEDLILPEGLETIGAGAFGRAELTSIVIPDSVKTIGSDESGSTDSGFRTFGTSLESVTFGKGLEVIGADVFSDSAMLREADLSGCTKLESIGKNAFGSCGRLKTVKLPANLKEIGNRAFYRTKLESITLPDNITELPDGVFAETPIKSVVLPKNLKTMGTAFEKCTELTSITLPEGFTVLTGYPPEGNFRNDGGGGAFSGCTKLTTVKLPSTIEKIGDCTFKGCPITEISIPDSVTEIGEDAFANCKLASLTLPASLTTIGRGAFKSSIETETENQYVDGHWIDAIVRKTPSHTFEEVTIPAGVTEINGFEDCVALKKVTALGNVTAIGESAFTGCENLESITFKTAPTQVLKNAFSGCTSLKSFDISALTDIGINAFTDCKALEAVEFNTAIKSKHIGSGAFKNCTSVKEVTIPANITKIPAELFMGCSGIDKITIEDGVTDIGNSAFEGCEAMEAIVLPDSIFTIGERAFYGCLMPDVYVPDNVEEIGIQAFGFLNGGQINGTSNRFGLTATSLENTFITATYVSAVPNIHCSSNSACAEYIRGLANDETFLTYTFTDNEETNNNESIFEYRELADGTIEITDHRKVVLPTVLTIPEKIDGKTVTSIGAGVFSYNTDAFISKVVLPDTITNIGENAFYGTACLSEINFPKKLKTIGDYAFKDSGITSAILPEGLTTIGYGVFTNCLDLEEVSIPDTVVLNPEIIGWTGAFVGSGDKKTNHDEWFKGCTSLSKVSLPDNMAFIPRETFSGCVSLTEITIPSSAEYIGGRAFSVSMPDTEGEYGLTSIDIPESVKEIGSNAFSGQSRLSELTLHEGIETIKTGAFSGCAIKSFDIPVSLTYLSGFDQNPIESIAIPSSVYTVGEQAFWCCKNVKEITIGNGVKEIEDYAFLGCNGVHELVIPESVEYVGASICGYSYGNFSSDEQEEAAKKEAEAFIFELTILAPNVEFKENERLGTYSPISTGENIKEENLTMRGYSGTLVEGIAENYGIRFKEVEVIVPNAKGDVNGDKEINLKDVVLLRRYIAGGWDVNIDENAADVDHNGEIDLKDVVMLRRFIAGDWDIELS